MVWRKNFKLSERRITRIYEALQLDPQKHFDGTVLALKHKKLKKTHDNYEYVTRNDFSGYKKTSSFDWKEFPVSSSYNFDELRMSKI